MKTSGNTTVLVNVNNTVKSYSEKEISIKGKINLFDDRCSSKIPYGQEVIIIHPKDRRAYHAWYKAYRKKNHIFEVIGTIRLHKSVKLTNTFNGFKKISCEFVSFEDSLLEIIAKTNAAMSATVSTSTNVESAAKPVDIVAFQKPEIEVCHADIRTMIKDFYRQMQAIIAETDQIINHLDAIFGHSLTLRLNQSLTDTPPSLYSTSIIQAIDYDALLREIRGKLSEKALFDFDYRYNGAIRFENLGKKEALQLAADFISDAVFAQWLHTKLNPARKAVTTRELIAAICLNDFDWAAIPVKAA